MLDQTTRSAILRLREQGHATVSSSLVPGGRWEKVGDLGRVVRLGAPA